MVKRTREMSLASTVPADSLDSRLSVEDNEYIEEAATSRPTTRRRRNNGRSIASSNTSAQLSSLPTDIESPTPSSTQADDPKSTRKLQRKERNRISAQHSRDRKKNESQELRGRLEEAETRMLALQADNERLREENGRFKLELEKSSSLQTELVSLKERFEILERLLLAGSSQQSSSLPPSTSTSHVATSTSAIPSLSQSPISAPVQADSRIGSEAHATGMHSLFRSTTSLDSRSEISGTEGVRSSRQSMSNNRSGVQGSTVNRSPPSTTTPSTTSSSRSAVPLPPATTKAHTRLSKTSIQARAAACLPTSRLSPQDKQRFLFRQQLRQQAAARPTQMQLPAHLLARAKLVTMTMIDSLSNNRRI